MCDSITGPDRLPDFIKELKLYKDVNFEDYEDDTNYRSDTTDFDEAQVYSSQLRDYPDQHLIVLDVDVPAVLIPSSTPGHNHLVIAPNQSLSWDRYEGLLFELMYCGVIEEGYYRASKDRRATCVRLPWIKKPSQPTGDGEPL